MTDHLYEFENLSTKLSFNRALGHFQTVADLLGSFEDFTNIADYLNDLLLEKEIDQNQLLPTVNAILFDKFNYTYQSYNMVKTIENFSTLTNEVKNWNGIDIVMVYYHPDLGPMLVNPKNSSHFDSIHTFKRNELITIYAGSFSAEADTKKNERAISLILKFLDGRVIKTPDILKKGKFKLKEKNVEKPEKSRNRKTSTVRTTRKSTAVEEKSIEVVINEEIPKRITPYYSVPVTNELFHNGNVEAWKKIIQSYNTKYPSLEVYIYYDGERIHDIHSLFKWGKVKHGSTILFAVAGDEIRDVAKLQRYLKQGASIMFESFLNFPVNKILNLF